MSSGEVLDEIKGRLDIVEIVSDYVALKRAGQNFRGLCPFHSEKTPSFMVSPSKQIFHCFGCGAGGDIFGFIMKQENMEFSEALDFLARKAGVELNRDKRGRSVRDKLIAMHKEAVKFYAEQLSKAGAAKEYLGGRGLTGQTAKDFALGYAPPGWRELYGHLRGKGYEDPVILQSGLVASGGKGVYDIFRERVMFPIADMQGTVIAFGGRVMAGGEPKYLNSPDTPLFKKSSTLYALDKAKDEIRKTKEAIIVEGYLDAIMCHQNGIKNTVAPLGTALTGQHVEGLAKKFECNILLVFDGDDAGRAAARRSLDIILEKDPGAKVSFLLLPEGEDPASLLKSRGAEHFRGLLGAASSMVDFMLRTSRGNKTERINETVNLIAKVHDPILREGFIKEVAEKIMMTENRVGLGQYEIEPERAIRKKLSELIKSAKKTESPTVAIAVNEEILLLSVLLHKPEKAPEVLKKMTPEEISDKTVKALLQRLMAGGAVSRIAETDEEKALVRRLTLLPGFDTLKADENIEGCIKKLTLRSIDGRIKEAGAAGDLKKLNLLIKERDTIMREVE